MAYFSDDELSQIFGEPEEAPERTVMGSIGDAGVAFAQGVVDTGSSLVGLLNFPTAGYAGKVLENGLGYDSEVTNEFLDGLYSPAQQVANQKVANAEGFYGKARAMLSNPSTIGTGLVRTLPLTAGGGAIGRTLFTKGLLKSGVAAGAVGEGAISAGATAEDIRGETEGGTLGPKQVGASVASGAFTAIIAMVGGTAAKKLGFADVDTMFAKGRLGTKDPRNIATRIVGGGITEGVFEEMPQSAQEQVWLNAATDKPLMEGVPESMAEGGIIGGVMGSVANVAARRQASPEAVPETDETVSPVGTEQATPPPPEPTPADTGTYFDPEEMERLTNAESMENRGGKRAFTPVMEQAGTENINAAKEIQDEQTETELQQAEAVSEPAEKLPEERAGEKPEGEQVKRPWEISREAQNRGDKTLGTINAEVEQFRGKGGIASENKELGFAPAFRHQKTGEVFEARDELGRPSGVHLLDGIPEKYITERDPKHGDVIAVSGDIESGFLRDGKFFTREDAAKFMRNTNEKATDQTIADKGQARAEEAETGEATAPGTERVRVYRGVSQGNKKGGRTGSYYTTDKDFARQFTQSGLESEVISTELESSAIYKKNPLPSATSEKDFDVATTEARDGGFKAVVFDEGAGEPNSIFVLKPKEALEAAPKKEAPAIAEKAQNAAQELGIEYKGTQDGVHMFQDSETGSVSVEDLGELPKMVAKKRAKFAGKGVHNTPTNSGKSSVPKPLPTDSPGETIADRLAGKKSVTVGTLIDTKGGDSLRVSLKPDTSDVGSYSVVISDGTNTQSFRMQYGRGKPIAEALGHWENYMNTDDIGRFVVKIDSPKKSIPKKNAPGKSRGLKTTGDAEVDARLAKLRSKQKRYGNLYGNEKTLLEVYERQEKADPSKWAIGDGVGYRVHRQINRGFRVVEIDPKTKMVRVRQVADTGLTSTGGSYDRFGDSWQRIGDLIRDRKYDSDKPTTPGTKEKVAAKKADEPAENYSTKISESGITLKDIRKVFKGQDVGLTKDGSVYVKTRSGRGLQIRSVESITPKAKAFKASYGRMNSKGELITGKYSDGVIELRKDKADRWTLYHETFHALEDAEMITPQEVKVLRRKIRDLAAKGKFQPVNDKDIGGLEDRARFIEDELYNRDHAGTVQRVLTKIRDFVDRLVNLVKRTARGVVRDVESGKVFEREGLTGKAESDTGYSVTSKKGPGKIPTEKTSDKPESGKQYPIAPRGEWWGDADYKKRGGKIVTTTPDAFLKAVRPLKIDEDSRENIDILKKHMESGKTLDPAVVYLKEGKITPGDHDGRHRAVAAKELGISDFPVILLNQGFDTTPVAGNPFLPNPSRQPGKVGKDVPTEQYSTVRERAAAFSMSEHRDSYAKGREAMHRHFNDFMYWIVDKNRPIHSVQRRLKKMSEKIDLFMSETQRPKITAARVKKAYDEEIKPLLQKMADLKVELNDFEEYAHAKHAPEANESLRLANSKRWLDKLIKVIPKTVKQEDGTRKRVEGFLEFRKKIESTEKSYQESMKQTFGKNVGQTTIPKEYHKLLTEGLEKFGDYSEQTKDLKKQWETFSAKPSGMTDKESAEILKKYKNNEGMETLREMLAEINNNKLETLRDAGILPEEEYNAISKKYKFYVPLYREGYEDSTYGTGGGLKPAGKAIKTRGGSTRNVVNILANSVSNYENAIDRAEKAKSARVFLEMIEANPTDSTFTIKEEKKTPKHDNLGNLRLYRDMFSVGPNEMRIMVDGKSYLIEVGKHDRDALLVLKTLKAENAQHGPIVSALSKVNRWLARINTSWSPEFVLSNFTRDIQTAKVNIGDTGVDSKKLFKGAIQSIKAIYAVERGKAKGTDLEAVYERFKASGGKIGWADVHGSVEGLASKLKTELKMMSGKAPTRKTVKKWLDLVDNANTAVENGVRLHVFKLATEQGMSDKKAAQIASDITVDFTKKGAAGPVINSLYLFANAGIQGSYRIMRAGAKSARVRRMMGGIVGAGFLVGLLNSMAGEDDDGEDYYNKIDDFVRERNMIFMVPGTDGKYVKIPAPWGYNFFWNVGTELSRAFTKEDYSALKGAGRLATVFAGAFNPVASGTLLQTLSPTIADPFVQVAENKNWFGGDLMPTRNKFDKTPSPDSQRYWKSASSGSKWVAKQLNDLTGGSVVRPGMIDVSPETLDLVVDTTGGSALRFFKDSLAIPKRLITQEETKWHQYPFWRRVAGDKPEWADSRIYYENLTEVLTAKEELKAYRGTPYAKKVRKDLAPVLRLVMVAKESERRLRKLRKQKKLAEARGNRVRAEQIQKRMNQIYKQFNRKFNRGK